VSPTSQLAHVSFCWTDRQCIDCVTMLLQTRWEQVEQLYHDNLVEAIGLRDCTVYQLQQLMASSKIVPSVISVEVHPFYKNEELVSFCKKKVTVTSSTTLFL